MGEVNSINHARLRSDGIKAQIDKLERLAHHIVVSPTFDVFDTETEAILIKIYGANHEYIKLYKYAALGEAEAMVNLPESAQEPQMLDIPKIGLQQRRYVLQGILTDLQGLETQESSALLGEDREDPPGPG